mmetsp:Transcript_6172/g.9270  ORF Transcript_6172/g.9270 Transcript_6172/m.9270 type:complete len:361 (+) Transcript_6172:167-1249(+)
MNRPESNVGKRPQSAARSFVAGVPHPVTRQLRHDDPRNIGNLFRRSAHPTHPRHDAYVISRSSTHIPNLCRDHTRQGNPSRRSAHPTRPRHDANVISHSSSHIPNLRRGHARHGMHAGGPRHSRHDTQVVIVHLAGHDEVVIVPSAVLLPPSSPSRAHPSLPLPHPLPLVPEVGVKSRSEIELIAGSSLLVVARRGAFVVGRLRTRCGGIVVVRRLAAGTGRGAALCGGAAIAACGAGIVAARRRRGVIVGGVGARRGTIVFVRALVDADEWASTPSAPRVGWLALPRRTLGVVRARCVRTLFAPRILRAAGGAWHPRILRAAGTTSGTTSGATSGATATCVALLNDTLSLGRSHPFDVG